MFADIRNSEKVYSNLDNMPQLTRLIKLICGQWTRSLEDHAGLALQYSVRLLVIVLFLLKSVYHHKENSCRKCLCQE